MENKDSVIRTLFYSVAGVLGLAAIVSVWHVIGAMNSQTVSTAVSYAAEIDVVSDPFQGFFNILWTIWFGVKVFFFVAIGLGVTLIVLCLLAVTGVLAWTFKRLGLAIAYVFTFIRAQCSSSPNPVGNVSAAGVGNLIVATDDEGDVKLLDVLEDHDEQLEYLTQEVERIVKGSGIVKV